MSTFDQISDEAAGAIIERLRRFVLLHVADELEVEADIRTEVRKAMREVMAQPRVAAAVLRARVKAAHRLTPSDRREGGYQWRRALQAMSPKDREKATSFWRKRKNLNRRTESR